MSGEESDDKVGANAGDGASAAVEDEGLSEAELASLDAAPAHDLRALIKRSVVQTEEILPEPAKDAELLASVQKKLRKRSRGKFYGDGWSTAQTRLNYALIALVMLVTIAAVYLALGPTGFSLR